MQTRNHSISVKLTWMNILVTGGALLLACAAFCAYDFVSFRQATVLNLSIQAQIIGSNTASAILFNDPQSAEDTLAALKASPSILYAGIYKPDDQFFAGYWRDQRVPVSFPANTSANQREAGWFEDGQVAIVRPIIFQGKTTGIVYIRSDLRQINERLTKYLGIAFIVLLASLMTALLVSSIFRRAIAGPIVRLAEVARSVSRSKDYSVRAVPSADYEEIYSLIHSFNQMLAQIQERDRALQSAHDELEQRVQQRTAQLTAANQELEAFSYSVSHDLRSPLRTIDGFSQALLEDYAERLDDEGKGHLSRIRAGTQRMAQLIDDLLNLARVTRAEMSNERFDISAIARSVAAELQKAEPHRNVEFRIAERLEATGDPRLLRIVLENLFGNAWKFTSKKSSARIEFGEIRTDASMAYFVRDNGAGFDPAYSSRLFGAFQRLHSPAEFNGTGIGLATVQRILRRHGGEIWAEGKVDHGAAFYFTLWPVNSREKTLASSLIVAGPST